jgi:hypothetical protein
LKNAKSLREVACIGERYRLFELLAAGQVDAAACDSWLAASSTTARTSYGTTLSLTDMSGLGFALAKNSRLTE